MDSRFVSVPASVLLDSSQTAHDKLVWIALQVQPDANPARVEALTGLSRHTVLNGLGRGLSGARDGARVKMPLALLGERSLRAPAKVLYGQLQTLPEFRGFRGRFTYPGLSAWTRLSPNALKRAMLELDGSGWVVSTQKSRVSPINFRLGTPELRRREAELTVASRRLKRANFGGEAIMQEYLSLLIDSKDFADNIRPGFLVNPLTGERLELDRFYRELRVAFEFHGEQHDRPSERFSQREVDEQRLRDLIKAGLCVYAGIQIVVVRAEDLSLQGMQRKIPRQVPLRNLEGQERLIDLLEGESIKYQAAAWAARGAGLQGVGPSGRALL